MAKNPDCQHRGPHSNHRLLGPGGNKPGAYCGGTPSADVLGNVTDAREALNLDAAELWDRVSSGQLLATRDSDSEPWTISRAPL